ncbi:hypothetical protein MBFIL_05110 [Methanobrevibacter filiformis]|uniref:Uncharacterized protein n=1 Tax=Methanobrevibacter filiformis TaxID=55758 RepID=A0A166ECQ4_9EURY|nr:hypothetical protein MBFIL_05110 [Methanobrevibacter filiformis]
MSITVVIIGNGTVINTASVTVDQNNTNNDNGTDNSTFDVNFTKDNVDFDVVVPGGSVGDTIDIVLNLTDGDGNPVNTVSNVTLDGVNYVDIEFIDGIATIHYNITEVKDNITVGFVGNNEYNGNESIFDVSFTKGGVGDTIDIVLNLTDDNVRNNDISDYDNNFDDGDTNNNTDYNTDLEGNNFVNFNNNNKNTDVPNNLNAKNSTTNAGMKTTGIPLIAIIIILSLFGLISFKRKE